MDRLNYKLLQGSDRFMSESKEDLPNSNSSIKVTQTGLKKAFIGSPKSIIHPAGDLTNIKDKLLKHSVSGLTESSSNKRENESEEETLLQTLEEVAAPLRFVSSLWKLALDMNCIADEMESENCKNFIRKRLHEEVAKMTVDSVHPLDILEELIMEVNATMEELINQSGFSFTQRQHYSSMYATNIRQSLFRVKKLKKMLA